MRRTALLGSIIIVVGLTGPAIGTVYTWNFSIDLDESQIYQEGNLEFWLYRGDSQGGTGNLDMYQGDTYNTTISFENNELLLVEDLGDLVSEYVLFSVRSANSNPYTASMLLVLSGPDGTERFVDNSVPSGALNQAERKWEEEYLDDVGGSYRVEQIDASFTLVSATWMEFSTFNIRVAGADVSIVPEPGCAGFVVLGGLAVLRRRRRG